MQKTAKQLREILSTTLQALVDQEISPVLANSRATTADKITKIVAVQMKGQAALGQKYTDDVVAFLNGDAK